MNNRRFQLLFVGVEGQGEEQSRSKAAIAKRFQLDAVKASLLFSGKPTVVKRNLDAETAIHYKRIVDGLGGITRIEAMPMTHTPASPNTVERRSQTRRLLNDRRSRLRIRAIDTNRRRNKGRRRTDYERVS